MENSEVIKKFYESFAAGDIENMLSCYHSDIEFEDPAFGKLKGERAKSMWRMLLSNNKTKLKVTFSNIQAEGNTGSANWRAEYLFSGTGRTVVNIISAKFEFKENQIVKHVDHFNLHRWAGQAMGITGTLIGWTGYFKNKLNMRTKNLLDKFISFHSEKK